MTENKRFKLIDGIKKGTHSGIWDNQKQHNMGIGDELWLGEVVGMLNEGVILAEETTNLKEENEQLKSKYSEQCSQLDFLKDENKHMRKLVNENEQLKQFKEDVFNKIDMHLQRLPTLRDDEFESDNEFADPSLYSGAIQILETMKIELKGDVE